MHSSWLIESGLFWNQVLQISYDEDQWKVAKFLNHFKTTHQSTGANPFVIPGLKLYYFRIPPLAPDLLELLSLYGTHLKALHLTCTPNPAEVMNLTPT